MVRGPGRPPGATNLLTRSAKEVIQSAAEGLGGMKRLVEWAQEDPINERLFWGAIYPRLIPHQENTDGGGMTVNVVQFVKNITINNG